MTLVTIDLDGTLLPHTTAYKAVLEQFGRGADVDASDAEFFGGRASLEEVFWQQWEWFKAHSVQEIHRALRKAAWLPNLAEGMERLLAHGLEVRVLTDQPSCVVEYLNRYGFEEGVCSPVKTKEGMLVDVDARFEKWENLRRFMQHRNLPAHDVLHVGNSGNDVPIWKNTGRGIAVFAPDNVAKYATLNLGEVDSFHVIVDAVLAELGLAAKP